MRILILNSFFGPFGGAEIIAYDTYKLLQKNGNEVFFYATDRKPFFEQNYEYSKYFPKDNFTTLGYLKNPIQYYKSNQNEKKLKQFLELIKPDIIHMHNILAFSPSILKICKDFPTVLTIHQADISCPASTLMFRNKKICTEQLCQGGNYFPCVINNCVRNNIEASIRRSFLIYLYVKNLKYIDKFITPSNALKNAVLKSNVGIKNYQIETISNFLNNKHIQEDPTYSNKSYFLYIGRLSKEKNVISLLKAMNTLPKEIKLHIVGKGPEEDNLKQFVKVNNLTNVSFLGFKKDNELKDEYKNCIATILPCNWFEIFGMTNIESFINGKPVIASNIGGIPEIVEHNITGLLFEPSNEEQLRNCILTYWNNPELVVEHGKNGYQKARTLYTEETYYKKIFNLYEEIIKQHEL